MSKLCPSAQPGMDQCRVLGVVHQDGPAPMLQYLNEHVPATPELLALGMRISRAQHDLVAEHRYEQRLRVDFPDSQQTRALTQTSPGAG